MHPDLGQTKQDRRHRALKNQPCPSTRHTLKQAVIRLRLGQRERVAGLRSSELGDFLEPFIALPQEAREVT